MIVPIPLHDVQSGIVADISPEDMASIERFVAEHGYLSEDQFIGFGPFVFYYHLLMQ